MRLSVSAMLLAGIAILFSELAAADAVADLRAFYANTRNLQTEFRQLLIDENGTVSQSQEGRFWLARPGKLRWIYERPYRQEMVNDGQRFWLYDEDLSQVTVRPSAEALQNAPMQLLSGGPGLDEQFTIKALASQDGVDWVEIRPRAAEGDFLSARMGLKNGLPTVLELQDSLGQQTRILFLNMRRNQKVDASRFRFTVPPGVDVVGNEPEPAS